MRDAVNGGHCAQHQSRRDGAASWRMLTDREVEKRRRYAVMARREAESESAIEDVLSVARVAALELIQVVTGTLDGVPARWSHIVADELGIDVGAASAALERLIRNARKEIADAVGTHDFGKRRDD